MSKLKISFWVGLTGIILVLSMLLRLKNLALVPRPGESMDEYSNAWVGLSLIRLGIPVGRSGLIGYGGNDYRYVNVDHFFSNTAGGNPLGINKPWFDHPPLLGLITGGYALVAGAQVFEETTARIIRRPMIIIGVAAVVATGWLAYLLYGPGAGAIAMAIAGTSPLMVVSSRMGQGENLLIVFWLLSLICLFYYKKREKRRWLWLTAMMAGLAMLSKVSGAAAVFTGGIILFNQDKKSWVVRLSKVGLFVTVSLSLLALFFVYGLAIDGRVFVNVWLSNSNRPYDIGYSPIFNLITTTKITISKLMTDGWPLIGWFGIVALWFKNKRHDQLFIILPLIIYLVIFLLMGGSSYGWYRTPFMPFLIIAAAWVSVNGLEKGLKTIPIVLLLIPLGINLGKINELIPLTIIKPYLRLGWPLVILVSCVLEFLPFGSQLARPTKMFYCLLLALALISNVIIISLLTPEAWLSIN